MPRYNGPTQCMHLTLLSCKWQVDVSTRGLHLVNCLLHLSISSILASHHCASSYVLPQCRVVVPMRILHRLNESSQSTGYACAQTNYSHGIARGRQKSECVSALRNSTHTDTDISIWFRLLKLGPNIQRCASQLEWQRYRASLLQSYRLYNDRMSLISLSCSHWESQIFQLFGCIAKFRKTVCTRMNREFVLACGVAPLVSNREKRGLSL